jgi:hypothetical protein
MAVGDPNHASTVGDEVDRAGYGERGTEFGCQAAGGPGGFVDTMNGIDALASGVFILQRKDLRCIAPQDADMDLRQDL